MANKFQIPKLEKAVDFALTDALAIAARDAKVWFDKSFQNQGFTDETLEKWQPRKGSIRQGMFRMKRNNPNTKPTLYGKGNLKRATRITSFSKRKQVISNDLVYAEIHNEGLMGRAWGKHFFKMPKRQFIGNSRKLERFTQAKINSKINTAIMNSFK